MRILRLRSYCYPEVVAGSAMGEDMDEAFAKNGIVSVNYTPMPSRGITDEVRKAYKKKKYEEFRDGYVIVHRFPMIKEGTGTLRKAVKYFLCTLTEYRKGVKEKNVDALFCSSTPPTQGLLSAKVAEKLSKKYKRKVPFVYCLQDVFPDSLVQSGMTKRGSFLWKIGRKIENATYRRAEKIIVISENCKQNIMEKGVPEEKIVVIPNWGDTEGIYPVARAENPFFDEYALPRDKFYFCYAGTIGRMQNVDLLLDAAKEIAPSLPDVRFVFVGEGAAKPDAERRVREEAISNVIFLPFQPYEKMAQVFSLGDVGLITCKLGVGGSALPSKTWNIMAAERPILASFDLESGLASMIKTVGCGIVADAGRKDALIDAIRTLAAEQHLAEMGKRGKNYLETELNAEVCASRYVETLKSVEIANETASF